MSETDGVSIPKGRVMALDVGSVRIGVAVTDPLGLIAQGVAVWHVNSKNRSWREDLNESLKRYDPALILVGMPRRTDGSLGPEAERIAALVRKLQEEYPERRFETIDERFTTTIAQQALLEGDVSRKKRKENVDKIAASLILQSWLSSGAAGQERLSQ